KILWRKTHISSILVEDDEAVFPGRRDRAMECLTPSGSNKSPSHGGNTRILLSNKLARDQSQTEKGNLRSLDEVQDFRSLNSLGANREANEDTHPVLIKFARSVCCSRLVQDFDLQEVMK
ncbi:hypothetical protein OS493_040048, partial [Desmophyllum pertusum]